MNPLTVAAQFAAYSWYTECHTGTETSAAATEFARENWRAFLDHAQTGLGRLLMRVGRLDRPKGARGQGAGRDRTSLHELAG